MRSPGDNTDKERRIATAGKDPVLHTYDRDIKPIDLGPPPIDSEYQAKWPEPAAGGTTIEGEILEVDSDFPFGGWATFAAGALCSSIIWFVIWLLTH